MTRGYRFYRFLEQLKIRGFSRWYKWRLANVASNFVVTGPCFIYGEGKIQVGDNCRIASFSFNRVELAALDGAELTLGDHVFINQGSRIICKQKIDIGNHCSIAPEVLIIDSDYHSTGKDDLDPAPVVIGNDVWIATRAMILKGVTIGDGAVVAAGAVVTNSVPAHTLVAGVPARVVRQLDH